MREQVLTDFIPGERLDKTLALHFPEYSRSAIEKLIALQAVVVNKQSVKSKYLLKENDTVTIDFAELDRQPDTIDLPVLYEDDNVVAIDKPIGVLTHSKGEFNKEGTVASWLEIHSGNDGTFWQSNRAGIVHRLDRATSGVIICAKNETTQKFLQKQFSQRTVKKTYLAIIEGQLGEAEGIIDIPIERNPKKPSTFRAGANGKPAQTVFKVLKVGDASSLVELKPKTGRTHQLRVHLNYLKHPIVGDDLYSGPPADRLMLHAHQLELTLPGGHRTVFTSPSPKEFELKS